jgi:hypothetical protein
MEPSSFTSGIRTPVLDEVVVVVRQRFQQPP